MTTDPDQIRSTIATLLAELPEPDSFNADIEAIASRLEEAHDHLVEALESVERGPSEGGSAATRDSDSEGGSAATGEMGPSSEST